MGYHRPNGICGAPAGPKGHPCANPGPGPCMYHGGERRSPPAKLAAAKRYRETHAIEAVRWGYEQLYASLDAEQRKAKLRRWFVNGGAEAFEQFSRDTRNACNETETGV